MKNKEFTTELQPGLFGVPLEVHYEVWEIDNLRESPAATTAESWSTYVAVGQHGKVLQCSTDLRALYLWRNGQIRSAEAEGKSIPIGIFTLRSYLEQKAEQLFDKGFAAGRLAEQAEGGSNE